MIEVTKLNNETITVNAEMIELLEETPDTIINLSNGRKIIVKETREQVKNLIISYKKEVYSELFKLS